MITIFIAFSKTSYKGTAPYNKLISKWTIGPYHHTELILPNKYSDIEEEYVMWSSTPTTGVRYKRHIFNDERYAYKDILVTEEELQRIYNFYESIEGEKYDKFGILGFVIPTKDRSDEWFCSETSSNAMKIIGKEFMWRIEPSSVSPNELARLVGLLDGESPKFYNRIANLFKSNKYE